MERLTKAEARANHGLYVEFDDGVSGVVDLSGRLFGPMFEPLKDEHLFQQVVVDEFGAAAWPNGADLAPDALREALAAPAPSG